jgi:hypothetical protein
MIPKVIHLYHAATIPAKMWRLEQVSFRVGVIGENGQVLLDLVQRRCIEVEDVFVQM